jgi:hypothetical protein
MVEFFDDELLLGMAQQLKLASTEQDLSVDNAVKLLNEAYDIFKNEGHTIQAAKISSVIEKLAAGKAKKVDRHTKGLTPEKQVANLKDHGTQFNLSQDCAIELPAKKDTLEPEDMDPEFADLMKSFDFNNTEDDAEEADFEDEIDLPEEA